LCPRRIDRSCSRAFLATSAGRGSTRIPFRAHPSADARFQPRCRTRTGGGWLDPQSWHGTAAGRAGDPRANPHPLLALPKELLRFLAIQRRFLVAYLLDLTSVRRRRPKGARRLPPLVRNPLRSHTTGSGVSLLPDPLRLIYRAQPKSSGTFGYTAGRRPAAGMD
jgi:hypothetical protein